MGPVCLLTLLAGTCLFSHLLFSDLSPMLKKWNSSTINGLLFVLLLQLCMSQLLRD